MPKRTVATHHPKHPDSPVSKIKNVIFLIALALAFVGFVLFFIASNSPANQQGIEEYNLTHRKFYPALKGSERLRYAVVFDAGSSGSRVHVFCFDGNLDLVPIADGLELFRQRKPGLSFYAKNPMEAAASLIGLLDKAEGVVPEDLRPNTPVKVGATAGLRALEGDASDRILQAVRELLKTRSMFKSEPEGVRIIDGTQEGSYQWVTINYLLGNLGKSYSDTVGVVDLGGGSVQMAYAISESAAAKAPKLSDGEEIYVSEMYLKGRKYYLYVHSYLRYGLLAARAEILKISDDSANPCIPAGYQETYKYGGQEYKVSAPASGPSLNECINLVSKALKVNETKCTHMRCTFGGIWNGGGGDGRKNLFVASFFFDRAAEAGFIDSKQPVAKVRPEEFKEAAKRACETKFEDFESNYPDVEEGNRPYLCMDLGYQYTLLVDGFGLDPWQYITLVKKVKYGNSLVEAAWPLGCAIEAVSSLT